MIISIILLTPTHLYNEEEAADGMEWHCALPDQRRTAVGALAEAGLRTMWLSKAFCYGVEILAAFSTRTSENSGSVAR